MKFNKEKAIEEFQNSENYRQYVILEQCNAEFVFGNWLAEDIECPECEGTGKAFHNDPRLYNMGLCFKCQGKGTILNLMRFVE